MRAPLLTWPMWLRALLAVAVLALSCPGCGSQAVRRHGQAAIATRGALDVAAAGIESVCDPDVVGLRNDAPRRARRCLDAARAHDLARVAWDGWAAGILLALDDGLDAADLLPLALAMLPHWSTLAEAAEWWGLDLPPLPPLLTGGTE